MSSFEGLSYSPPSSLPSSLLPSSLSIRVSKSLYLHLSNPNKTHLVKTRTFQTKIKQTRWKCLWSKLPSWYCVHTRVSAYIIHCPNLYSSIETTDFRWMKIIAVSNQILQATWLHFVALLCDVLGSFIISCARNYSTLILSQYRQLCTYRSHGAPTYMTEQTKPH